MELKRFSELVESLYEAPLTAVGWQGMADKIASAFDAGSCKFQFQDIGGTQAKVLGATANFDAQANADYESYYFAKDPCVAGAKKLGVGVPVLTQDIISISDMLSSEIYSGYARRIDVVYLVGAMLPVGANALGGLGIHRGYRSEPFDAEDKKLIGFLVPHLTRAFQLQARINHLERDRLIGFEGLEALEMGVMVVNAVGRLLFANRVADGLLKKGHGIRMRQGQLRGQMPAGDLVLQRAIRDAQLIVFGRSVTAGGIIAIPRPEGLPLSLMVCPVPPNAATSDLNSAAAIIFVNNPDDRFTPTQSALMTLFALTPAEARLTAALLDGETLDEYARHAGISPHTARVQLKHVFAKTGCSRQVDLIRRILANPVLRMCRSG